MRHPIILQVWLPGHVDKLGRRSRQRSAYWILNVPALVGRKGRTKETRSIKDTDSRLDRVMIGYLI